VPFSSRASVVVLALAAATVVGCKTRTPVINEPFAEPFDRAEIGAGWLDTSGGQFRIRDGKLNVQGGLNRPLWLRKRLPRDLVVELDVMSKSDVGDIKIELFGDGESFDPDQGTYFPTGYVFVFGGWSNELSIIGKLGEHEDAVKVSRPHKPLPRAAATGPLAGAGAGDIAAAAPPAKPASLDDAVVPGRTYRWVITRKGGQIDWKIDGQPFLSWSDPAPLYGDDKGYLGFNNWQSDVYFDNLTIRPAP
jgi:hypothetical protein